MNQEHGRGDMALKRVPACTCGATGVRDEKHDAYYCPISGTWLEETCTDRGCEFCGERPATRAIEVVP